MNIIGVGTDIVNISRLKLIIKKNSSFKKRIFSKKEISYCEKKKLKIACFAKRFAAKEAFSKALGSGITKGIKFNEIEVINDKMGKPNMNIYGSSLKIISKLLKKKNFNVYLTLSDENPFATATVILTTK
tara:strand:+ start:833 stop:1222 length:390 start_codon:yes stop_codon:yes gene_type:complete